MGQQVSDAQLNMMMQSMSTPEKFRAMTGMAKSMYDMQKAFGQGANPAAAQGQPGPAAA